MNSESIPPQIQSLLLLCAQAPGDGAAQQKIRDLVRECLDCDRVLSVAAQHGMAPLVCRQLDVFAGDAMPQRWRERFQQEFARNVRRNLVLTAELFRIIEGFQANGVHAVPYKGPVLAALAYGDLALRQFADLDIVVPHSEIAEAARTLLALGYNSELDLTQARDLHFVSRGHVGQISFWRPGALSTVELHTERTMHYFPVPLDWERLRPRLRRVRIGGGSLDTFSLEDTLCVLSVHGTKHFWERLGWIIDLSNLVQLPRGIDWILLEEIARGMRCWKMVLLGAALANRMLETPLPDSILEAIRRDSTLPAMCRRRVKDFFSRREYPGVVRRLRFRVQSYDTLGQGVRQCVRLATQPTEDDWKAVRLSPGWEWLYLLVRPWRLLQKHGLGLAPGSSRRTGAGGIRTDAP